MKRRSKFSSKSEKPTRASAKLKRSPPSTKKMSSSVAEEAGLRRLIRERDEAREQYAAATEVLGVISSTPGELDRVFQVIVANSTRLCEAKYANLYLFADGAFRLVSTLLAQERLSDPLIRPSPGTGLGRMVEAKATIQIADVMTDRDYPREDPLGASANWKVFGRC
jgi:hypothetical protein